MDITAKKVNAHDDTIRDVDFNPNKPLMLLTTGHDRKIKFWDMRNMRYPHICFNSIHRMIICLIILYWKLDMQAGCSRPGQGPLALDLQRAVQPLPRPARAQRRQRQYRKPVEGGQVITLLDDTYTMLSFIHHGCVYVSVAAPPHGWARRTSLPVRMTLQT